MNKKIMDVTTQLLESIGEDVNREGLVETPTRVARMSEFLFSGYNEDPKKMLTVFSTDGYDEIVLLKNIEFYSICEHHLLPFFGKAHIAYLPSNKIVGVSKLARLLDIFSRRVQIQERLCQQVTSTLMECLAPQGAACILEAKHLCMVMRGVEKQNSMMVTSSMEGLFRTSVSARQELLNLIER